MSSRERDARAHPKKGTEASEKPTETEKGNEWVIDMIVDGTE